MQRYVGAMHGANNHVHLNTEARQLGEMIATMVRANPEQQIFVDEYLFLTSAPMGGWDSHGVCDWQDAFFRMLHLKYALEIHKFYLGEENSHFQLGFFTKESWGKYCTEHGITSK